MSSQTITRTFTAATDLSAYQGYIVEKGATSVVDISGAADAQQVGIITGTRNGGKDVDVAISGPAFVRAQTTLTPGTHTVLTSHSDGRARPATAGEKYVCRLVSTRVILVGELAEVIVEHGNLET